MSKKTDTELLLTTIPLIVFPENYFSEIIWNMKYLVFKVTDKKFNKSAIVIRLLIHGRYHNDIVEEFENEINQHYHLDMRYIRNNIDIEPMGGGTLEKIDNELILTGESTEFKTEKNREETAKIIKRGLPTEYKDIKIEIHT